MTHFVEKKQAGFSLIEIIIVLLIISIIAVMAVPKLNQSRQLYNLQIVSASISDRLMEARLTAIKYNRSAWLEIDKTAKTIKVLTTDEYDQPVESGITVRFSEDIVITPDTPTTIVFNSLGRNQSNSDSRIRLKTGKNRYCQAVTVSVVGKTSSAQCRYLQ